MQIRSRHYTDGDYTSPAEITLSLDRGEVVILYLILGTLTETDVGSMLDPDLSIEEEGSVPLERIEDARVDLEKDFKVFQKEYIKEVEQLVPENSIVNYVPLWSFD